MSATATPVAARRGARPLLRPPRPRAHIFGLATVWLLMAVYGLFFGWLSLERYWAYDSHALDLGNMAQAAWNTIHGHPFRFTNMRLPFHGIEAWGTTTRLSFHVEYLFPVISLVYLIYPHPESLLILQTVLLALGALPVYLLARDVLKSVVLAVLFAALYLLYPTLEALNLYEFHPVSLATPLLLVAFLALWRRQAALFVISSLAAMGTKEEIGLVVAMFAIFALLAGRLRRSAAVMAIVGVAWSLLAVLVIEKHYRQAGVRTYLASRYGYLGHGIHGAINTVLHHPHSIAQVLFVWPKLDYLERLLAPFGYLSLLSPAVLLGWPTLVLNLFSTDFHMYSALGADSAELIAVMAVAAILGAALLQRILHLWLPARGAAVFLAIYLLAQALWSQHLNGFTPIGDAFQRPSIGAHQHLIDQFVAMVPAGQPVSTQDQIDPHLSDRADTYLFPDTGQRYYAGAPNAYTVLLDVSAPTYPLPSDQLYDAAQALLHHGWGVTAADDGLILLQTGITRTTPPAQFYRYANADGVQPAVSLAGSSEGLDMVGYTRTEVDQPNHPVPVLAYTIYLRPANSSPPAVQPVLFETMGKTLMNCSYHPLGLDWFPSTRWHQDHTYAVRLDPLETAWNIPGRAQLWLTLAPMSSERSSTCTQLWAFHDHLWPAGTLSVGQ